MSRLFPSGGQSIGTSASVLFDEYSGLIFFKIDWFDLFEVQGKKRGDGCILSLILFLYSRK